jgi:hypothetical protein
MTKWGGRSFWDPGSNPMIYFGAVVFLSLALNLLSAQLSSLYPWLSLSGAIVIVFSMTFIILSPVVRALWPSRSREAISTVRCPGRKFRGVVVLISQGRGSATAQDALRYHGDEMKHAWLIHSEASRVDAETLKEKFPLSELVSMSNPDFEDPEAVKGVIESSVFGSLGKWELEEPEVVIDITGGPKGATAGAFLAGLSERRNLEIVQATRKDENGYGVENNGPCEITIAYKVKSASRSDKNG